MRTFKLALGWGGRRGTVDATASIGSGYPYSNIAITFSEEMVPATITNAGDGTGTFELKDTTADSWVAGSLTTADNITWTFNPTAYLTVGNTYRLYLSDTIEGAETGKFYDGGDFIFDVTADDTAPTLADVVAGVELNTITFSDPQGPGTPDSFNLYWSTTADQPIGSMTKISGVTSPHVHSGLTVGVPYYYKVTAVRGGDESLPSAEDSGTPTEAITYATLDSANKSAAITLSNGDLTASITAGGAWAAAWFNTSKTSGKYAIEITNNEIQSTTLSSGTGIADTRTTNSYIGGFTNSVGLIARNVSDERNNTVLSGSKWDAFTADETKIVVVYDFDNKKIVLVKTGALLASSALNGAASTFYAGISLYSLSGQHTITVNTGAIAFSAGNEALLAAYETATGYTITRGLPV